MLSHDEIKAVYDKLGAAQDTVSFFEAPALALLRQHAALERARAVFEFGCGTGSFAATLLADDLPAAACYVGLDQSTTMVQLAAARLTRFGPRAIVLQSDGTITLPASTGGVDRFVCNYVLDLLPEREIVALLAEAHRVLQPGGLLCLTTITHGTTPVSRVVMQGWQLLYWLQPERLGGCRPIAVHSLLDHNQWTVRYQTISITRGLASEVVVAARVA